MVDKKTIKEVGPLIFIILVIGALLYFNGSSSPSVDIESYEEGEWVSPYQDIAREGLTDYSSLTLNTDYYDYDDVTIASIAEEISRSSENSRDAIEKTLEYVNDHVDYVFNEPDQSCYAGTAPNILESGEGQCDTQSITVVSILRKMGIASKPIGGCIVLKPKCQLQSFFLGSVKTLESGVEGIELDPEAQTFSRADLKSRKGGLHAWVAAWTPEEGWLTLEATSGKLANLGCYYYHVELMPSNNNKDDICVSKSWDYARACQNNDIETMNQYGLGLMEEVLQ